MVHEVETCIYYYQSVNPLYKMAYGISYYLQTPIPSGKSSRVFDKIFIACTKVAWFKLELGISMCFYGLLIEKQQKPDTQKEFIIDCVMQLSLIS